MDFLVDPRVPCGAHFRSVLEEKSEEVKQGQLENESKSYLVELEMVFGVEVFRARGAILAQFQNTEEDQTRSSPEGDVFF